MIKDQRDTYKIWSVYNSQKTDNIVKRLDEIEEIERQKTIIGGDFNIRIGEEGKYIDFDRGGQYVYRKSKDKKCSNG